MEPYHHGIYNFIRIIIDQRKLAQISQMIVKNLCINRNDLTNLSLSSLEIRDTGYTFFFF